MGRYIPYEAEVEVTVEDILNHEDSERLIKTHVFAFKCEDCGTVIMDTVSDGWTDTFVCDGCDAVYRKP